MNHSASPKHTKDIIERTEAKEETKPELPTRRRNSKETNSIPSHLNSSKVIRHPTDRSKRLQMYKKPQVYISKSTLRTPSISSESSMSTSSSLSLSQSGMALERKSAPEVVIRDLTDKVSSVESSSSNWSQNGNSHPTTNTNVRTLQTRRIPPHVRAVFVHPVPSVSVTLNRPSEKSVSPQRTSRELSRNTNLIRSSSAPSKNGRSEQALKAKFSSSTSFFTHE